MTYDCITNPNFLGNAICSFLPSTQTASINVYSGRKQRALAQAKQANYLQKALSNRAKNFQIIDVEGGEALVENVVQLGPLLAIKAGGSCAAEGSTRTLVSLDNIRAEIGPLR